MFITLILGLITMALPIIVSVLIRKYVVGEAIKQNKVSKSLVVSVLASAIINLLVLAALWGLIVLSFLFSSYTPVFENSYNGSQQFLRLFLALVFMTAPMMNSSFLLATSTADYATREAWRRLPKERFVVVNTLAAVVLFAFAMIVLPALVFYIPVSILFEW